MANNQKARGMILAVLVSYIIMITVNALANILPFNGITTGDISNAFGNLFAPAGITFSIWGVIYTLLALYVLYQMGVFRKDTSKFMNELLDKVAPLFVFSSLANATWMFAWHYKAFPLSLILMVIILICLYFILQILKVQDLRKASYFFLRLPFSIYFGWITVATIANATTLLVSLGWKGFGLSEVIWTILILIVGTAIGIATALVHKDIPYNLVIVWAYLGILIKHRSETGFAKDYPSIIITVYICLGLLLASVLFLALKKNRQKRTTA
ncbi:hypothetical protein SpiGrapes_0839 [Sphaerochaeta pleomorpha str. Grapes]|uniref:Lantibiotic ABC transporter permease n=1 Tax=Sphaerochaeta pleomorpha (strain ATCC BAA-1885 / DSM 22778 / Grapes) TaxID=158190 RepID=G8QQ90_SPHPG|nr:tryptophan-rich sensory protein [Sphaerochaeta pleomorpha]AEV28667.1 hypothetical protein SpiGrapes_0839 [Sphaerochaeta pleomorpha str. Grapes]